MKLFRFDLSDYNILYIQANNITEAKEKAMTFFNTKMTYYDYKDVNYIRKCLNVVKEDIKPYDAYMKYMPYVGILGELRDKFKNDLDNWCIVSDSDVVHIR